MSEIPVNLNELEELVGLVSQELLEKLAIENEIPDEDMSGWAMMSVDIVTFVINSYMVHMNNLMDRKALAATTWQTNSLT